MEIGLSTLEDEWAAQGLDWEEVLEQRAREQAKLRELGLVLSEAPPPAVNEDERDDEILEPRRR